MLPRRQIFHSRSLTLLSSPVIWLILYALVGPGLWLLYALGMTMAHARMNRMRRPAGKTPGEPIVSVLIPAKDEEDRVRLCLDSVLAQDYQNFYVICVNDRSTDRTGAIMDEIAAASGGKVQVIPVPQGGLPSGWLGKCHALHTAAKHARADWILFVDSDVKLQSDALSAAMALCVGREYDALSILTKLECYSLLEKLVLPLAAASVSTMCLVSMTNMDKSPIAFANGQFFLIRRAAYEAVNGHEAVKDHITEDVALMRLLKAAGFKTRLFLGAAFASTRMHSTYRQMLHGWGRIFSGVSSRRPWRILGALAFVLSGLFAYAGVCYGILRYHVHDDARWLIVAAAHLIIVMTILMVLYRWSGNASRLAWLFPVSAPILLSLYVYALKMCATGNVAWRGTNYTYTPTTATAHKT